jgi:plastocyanin
MLRRIIRVLSGLAHRRKLGWLSPGAIAATATTHVPAATPVGVDIKNFKFSLPTLTAPVGTTVTWTNHDEVTHTITSATGAFGSTGPSSEEAFAHTFTHPGADVTALR